MPKAEKVLTSIESLDLPESVYGGVHFYNNSFFITLVANENSILLRQEGSRATTAAAALTSWLRHYMKQNNKKIIALGISGKAPWKPIYSRLWLELDIVPIKANGTKGTETEKSLSAAKLALASFNRDDSHNAAVRGNGKVRASTLVNLADYEAISPPEEFQFLLNESNRFGDRSIAFVSATPQGGGVALMRHALMRLYALLDIKADWYVLKDDPQIFDITKRKFHNILQNVADSGVVLEEEEKSLFNSWSKKNAKSLLNSICEYKVVVIDDPQPSGLVPFIRTACPEIKIIYRSHIQLEAALADTPGTAQNITWSFIWDKIKSADLFIAHPVRSFVPKDVPFSKLVYAPPTTDPLDGLNKELTDSQKDYYFRVFNKHLINHGQTPLDPARPYIAQIARFDPSKGISDVLELFRRLRIRIDGGSTATPQLVIAGNGSVDDPDGVPILNMVKETVNSPGFSSIKDDIKVMRLPHYDQLLNTLARGARIVLQLSHKEGFEIKVSEALMKSKPVVIYNSGGMPVQVQDGINGFVLRKGDLSGATNACFKLLTDEALYDSMSKNASSNLSPDVLTLSSAASWLWLANQLIETGSINAQGAYIKELTGQSSMQLPRLYVI